MGRLNYGYVCNLTLQGRCNYCYEFPQTKQAAPNIEVIAALNCET